MHIKHMHVPEVRPSLGLRVAVSVGLVVATGDNEETAGVPGVPAKDDKSHITHTGSKS